MHVGAAIGLQIQTYNFDNAHLLDALGSRLIFVRIRSGIWKASWRAVWLCAQHGQRRLPC